VYDNVIFWGECWWHIGTEAPPLSMAFANAEDRRTGRGDLGKSKKNKEKIRD
jgi:hypothetical protein